MGLETMIYGEQSYILTELYSTFGNLIPLKSKEVSRVERVNNHQSLLYIMSTAILQNVEQYVLQYHREKH